MRLPSTLVALLLCGAAIVRGEDSPLRLPPADAPPLSPARDTPAVRAARVALPTLARLTVVSRLDGRVSHGSAVVIHAGGYLVTAHHVVAVAREIRVQLPSGETKPASLVAGDLDHDAALLRVATEKPPAAIVWGRSAQLQEAETVLALGNSLGRGTIVTAGIVNATRATAELPDGQKFAGLIQTDAALHVGMSGGALVNLDGEMVGLLLFVRDDEHVMAYALPTDKLRPLLERWLRDDLRR